MRNFKILLSVLAVCCYTFNLSAQLTGGTSRGVETPTTAKPEETLMTLSDGDVDLFSGTYQHNINLGTVSTTLGTSFTLNMNYSSSGVTARVQTQGNSIPYGEGWSLDLPSIQFVNTEPNRKYSKGYIQQKMDQYRSVVPVLFDTSTTSVLNNYEAIFTYCPDELVMEFVCSIKKIKLNIPGVYNGVMVLKYIRGDGEAVFVPKNFDKYLEMTIKSSGNPDLGFKFQPQAKVRLNDGTVYTFLNPISHYVNPPNLLIGGPKMAGPSAEPVLVYDGLRISTISNPHLSEAEHIAFKYKAYGRVNFYAEHDQLKRYSQNYSSYQSDVLLKEIQVIDGFYGENIIQRLELNYKNIGSLKTDDPNVTKLDDMYVYKTIFSTGENAPRPLFNGALTTNWSQWNAYQHAAIVSSNFGNWTATSKPNWQITNPYVYGSTGNWNHHRISGNSQANILKHTYIEKNSIPNDLLKPGKLYEIRVKMDDRSGTCPRKLIDIDLSFSKDPNEHKTGTGTFAYPPSVNSSATRGTLFSTFQRPIKWFDDRYEQTWNYETKSFDIHENTSSNLFLMPDYETLGIDEGDDNIILRIGPANSDHYMNAPQSGRAKTFPNGVQLNTTVDGYGKLYQSYNHGTLMHKLKCYKHCEPCGFNFVAQNFGLGLPWGTWFAHYLSPYQFTASNACDNDDKDEFFKFSHIHPNTGSNQDNEPTAVDSLAIEHVQISELVKLPYMLNEVKLYDYRTSLSVRHIKMEGRSSFGFPIKEDSNLVSIKELTYRNSAIRNAFNQSEYSQNDGYQVEKYLLAYLHAKSINSADNYTEDFQYDVHSAGNYISSNFSASTENYNAKFHLLKRITNNLGLKKSIEYYSDAKFRIQRNDVVQFKFIVSSITKEPMLSNSVTGNDKKITNYNFSNYVSTAVCYDKQIEGFQHAEVLHPINSVNGKRKKTKYEFHACVGCVLAHPCDPQTITNGLNLGKLKSVENFNENGQVIKKVAYEYKNKLAYVNGSYRFHRTSPLCAYGDGGFYPVDGTTKYYFDDMFGGPRPIPIIFEAVDHSYFCPKIKKITTDYFKDNSGNDVSVDHVEDYEYYDASYMGMYDNEAQKIVDEVDVDSAQYYIEPSWNLSKTTAYNTANPNFYSTKEIFYLYQFLNEDKCSGFDQFMEPSEFYSYSGNMAKVLLMKYNLRDLISEIRTSDIHKNPDDTYDTIRKSKYFEYEVKHYLTPLINENQEDDGTVYDSTLFGEKCPEFSEEERELNRVDSLTAALTSAGCELIFPVKFFPRAEFGGKLRGPNGEKPEDWDVTRSYRMPLSYGPCYMKTYNKLLGKWVICPCYYALKPNLSGIGVLGGGVSDRNVNMIGLNGLMSLSILPPPLVSKYSNPLLGIGTFAAIDGARMVSDIGRVSFLTAQERREQRYAYSIDDNEDMDNLVAGNISYRANAIDLKRIESILSPSNEDKIAFLAVPSVNKLITVNANLIHDKEHVKSLGRPYPYTDANYNVIMDGYNKLIAMYAPEDIVPIGDFLGDKTPVEIYDEISRGGDDEDPPMYYPPEHNMRILFKAEHEKIDDLVVKPSKVIRLDPENKYDIGRIVNWSSFHYHMPFHYITQKTILQRNNFLQTEIEMDSKGLLTRYYYGDYSFKQVCNNRQCPDINGNMVPQGGCHRAISLNSMFLPKRITTGFDRPDSVGINLYYNKNATLSKTISDQGAEIDYKYDGFNRLIETIKDGQTLAKYDYNTWDGTAKSNMDAITNQNYIQTRTWAHKGTNEGTISRSFIDPFGRKMGSILAAHTNISTVGGSYANAIMSGQQVWDWEEKPLKQFKPFEVSGALQLYRNTTTSGAPAEYQSFTYDYKSQPEKSYDYDVSSSSTHYSESKTTLVTGGFMDGELALNTLQKVLTHWDANEKYLRTETRDPDNKKHISYSYLNGKKLADHIPMGSAISDLNTIYAYDKKWDLKKVIDPEDLETNYLTNLQGLVFEKNSPDNGQTLYFYDESGNLVAMQDKNLWTQNILNYRVFTYDHFGRMLMQLRGRVDANALCPNCNFTGGGTGGNNSNSYYRPANPMAHYLYPGAHAYDISYPTTANGQVMHNTFGRSYHWLPNRNILDEDIEGVYTIFDSLEDIKIEKLFAYNDLDGKYVATTDMSPNHNALYNDKLNDIKNTIPVNIQQDIANKNQKSLGKLSAAASYNHHGQLSEVTTTTYNDDELPEDEYHYVKFRSYSPKHFLVQYWDYDLQGKAARTALYKYNLSGAHTPIYGTSMDYSLYGHLEQLRYKTGNATSYTTLADYSYDLPTGKLTNVNAYQPILNLNTSYTYDKRDRLTEIHNAMFEEKLYYDNNFPTTGMGTNIANYNGNINAAYAKFKGCAPAIVSSPLTYKYLYDNANRLANSFSDARKSASGALFGSQNYSYQRNGNISYYSSTELDPSGMSSFVKPFNFHYIWGTNKLSAVSPTSSGSVSPPYENNNRTFSYDANGNLYGDPYRKTNMNYGRANLPYQLVNHSSLPVTGSSTSYDLVYNTADARVLKGNDDEATYYLGAQGIYDMQADEWEHYPGGIARIKNNKVNLIIKDHLTNTRAIVDHTSDCFGYPYLAAYDYYPYGKVLRKWEKPSTAGSRSRFQSTDHETDIESGYNDRGARWWDDELLGPIQHDNLADHPKQLGMSPYTSFWNNPVNIIDRDGNCPDCTDDIYVPIAEHVYTKDLEKGMMTENGWEVMRVDENESGFRGALYKGVFNGKIEHIYAFQGTNPLSVKDWKNNLQQIASGDAPQYKQAVKEANLLRRDKQYKGVSYTGHSLGGGMASAAALVTQSKAVTFNAAGIGDKTRESLGLTNKQAKINAWVVEGEIVDYLQSTLGLKAEGNILYLPATYFPSIIGHTVEYGIRTFERVNNHFMGAAKKKFNKYATYKWSNH